MTKFASIGHTAPRKAASSLPQSGSPAQRELPAMHQPTPSLYRAATRSGSSFQIRLLPLSTEQPRAAGAPPNAVAFFASLYRAARRSWSSPQCSSLLRLSLSSSPVQRELPPNRTSPSLHRAAPRSGSFPRISLLPPSIGQPRAAGAAPKATSSLSQSGSLAQREPPPKISLLPPSIGQAPRSGSSPQCSLLPLSIEQPHAALPPNAVSCLPV